MLHGGLGGEEGGVLGFEGGEGGGVLGDEVGELGGEGLGDGVEEGVFFGIWWDGRGGEVDV